MKLLYCEHCGNYMDAHKQAVPYTVDGKTIALSWGSYPWCPICRAESNTDSPLVEAGRQRGERAEMKGVGMLERYTYAMWELTQLAVILIGALIISKEEGNLLVWAVAGLIYFICSSAKAKAIQS